MMDNESVFGGSFSADKSKLLVTSNRSGIYNMYAVSTVDGTFYPVTESDSSSVWATSYFPKDDRILFNMANNGDEIVAGVKKNGVPVEYVLFEDEGHGFVKKENQIESNRRILQFLDTI
jgi:Tol biopolymer transport system component